MTWQEPDQLFEVLSQSLLASMDRDALSGWGAVVHIMYVHDGCHVALLVWLGIDVVMSCG